jgi:hypothetical protein
LLQPESWVADILRLQQQLQLQEVGAADQGVIPGDAELHEQQQQQGEAGESTRQLLWQLLNQLKPAACPWYKHGATHYSQQQQQQQQQQHQLIGSHKALAAAVAVPE